MAALQGKLDLANERISQLTTEVRDSHAEHKGGGCLNSNCQVRNGRYQTFARVSALGEALLVCCGYIAVKLPG